MVKKNKKKHKNIDVSKLKFIFTAIDKNRCQNAYIYRH